MDIAKISLLTISKTIGEEDHDMAVVSFDEHINFCTRFHGFESVASFEPSSVAGEDTSKMGKDGYVQCPVIVRHQTIQQPPSSSEQWVHDSDGFIVIYHTISKASFRKVGTLINALLTAKACREIPVVIGGFCMDDEDLQEDEREVDIHELHALGKTYNCPTFEFSASASRKQQAAPPVVAPTDRDRAESEIYTHLPIRDKSKSAEKKQNLNDVGVVHGAGMRVITHNKLKDAKTLEDGIVLSCKAVDKQRKRASSAKQIILEKMSEEVTNRKKLKVVIKTYDTIPDAPYDDRLLRQLAVSDWKMHQYKLMLEAVNNKASEDEKEREKDGGSESGGKLKDKDGGKKKDKDKDKGKSGKDTNKPIMTRHDDFSVVLKKLEQGIVELPPEPPILPPVTDPKVWLLQRRDSATFRKKQIRDLQDSLESEQKLRQGLAKLVKIVQKTSSVDAQLVQQIEDSDAKFSRLLDQITTLKKISPDIVSSAEMANLAPLQIDVTKTANPASSGNENEDHQTNHVSSTKNSHKFATVSAGSTSKLATSSSDAKFNRRMSVQNKPGPRVHKGNIQNCKLDPSAFPKLPRTIAKEVARKESPFYNPFKKLGGGSSGAASATGNQSNAVKEIIQVVGKVTVRIKGATNLPKIVDPFVIVSLGRQEARTQRQKRTQAPQWDEQFSFDVTDMGMTLQLDLCDSGIILKESFLGRANIPLPSLVQRKSTSLSIPLQNRSGSKSVGGEVVVNVLLEPVTEKVSLADFEILSVIGKGAFGKVMQVKKIDTNRIYAMKVVKKKQTKNQKISLQREKDIMQRVHHPYIMELQFSFQTEDKLYLILDFVNGGDLYFQLNESGFFPEERARFYTAELFLALDYIHSMGIVYRDLKAENILLDYHGHIRLIDFGLAKSGLGKGEKTNTLCGTPDYLAPEVLLKNAYDVVIDWWALGVLVWEMLLGTAPFEGATVDQTFQNTLFMPIEPALRSLKSSRSLKDSTISFIRAMLQRAPAQRLGAKSSAEIKNHEFFEGISWDKLMDKSVAPPYQPRVRDEMDLKNFNQALVRQPAKDTLDDPLNENELKGMPQYNHFTFARFSDTFDDFDSTNPSAMDADNPEGEITRIEELENDNLDAAANAAFAEKNDLDLGGVFGPLRKERNVPCPTPTDKWKYALTLIPSVLDACGAAPNYIDTDEFAQALVYAFISNGLEREFITFIMERELKKLCETLAKPATPNTSTIAVAVNPNDTLSSKIVLAYANLIGSNYLHSTFKRLVAELVLGQHVTKYFSNGGAATAAPVQQNASTSAEGVDFNTVINLADRLLTRILTTLDQLPVAFRLVCRHLSFVRSSKYSSVPPTRVQALVVFQHFFLPVISSPEYFGVQYAPQSDQGALSELYVLAVLDVLTKVAENELFDEDAFFATELNAYIEQNKGRVEDYFFKVMTCSEGDDFGAHRLLKQSAEESVAVIELETSSMIQFISGALTSLEKSKSESSSAATVQLGDLNLTPNLLQDLQQFKAAVGRNSTFADIVSKLSLKQQALNTHFLNDHPGSNPIPLPPKPNQKRDTLVASSQSENPYRELAQDSMTYSQVAVSNNRRFDGNASNGQYSEIDSKYTALYNKPTSQASSGSNPASLSANTPNYASLDSSLISHYAVSSEVGAGTKYANLVPVPPRSTFSGPIKPALPTAAKPGPSASSAGALPPKPMSMRVSVPAIIQPPPAAPPSQTVHQNAMTPQQHQFDTPPPIPVKSMSRSGSLGGPIPGKK